MIKPKEEYRKIMVRPLNLIECQCWDFGERISLPKKFKNLIFFDPLFIYQPKRAVSIYYNFSDPKQNLQPLIDFLGNNISWFKKEIEDFDSNCAKIREVIKNKNQDYQTLFNLIVEIWPHIAVANSLGSTEYYKVSPDLKELFIKIREDSDDVLHPGISYLSKLVLELSSLKDGGQILIEEAAVGRKNKNISKQELKKRTQGWLYHKGKVFYDVKKYTEQNNIELTDVDLASSVKRNKIVGSSASPGSATGKVKLVFELEDLKKINQGDILVTPMTTPEMMVALKKAAAIVTDEGGVTCHAAIVSRELKKPCIIGTKNATKVLKDDDVVEVDAEKGIVKIINK